jgi:hypothetical protein
MTIKPDCQRKRQSFCQLLDFGHNVRVAAGFFGQHFVQDFFHGHSMTADFPGGEKGAGTLQLAVFQTGGIGVVFPSELNTKVGEGNPIGFLSVTLGFFNLSNNTGLHFLPPHNN